MTRLEGKVGYFHTYFHTRRCSCIPGTYGLGGVAPVEVKPSANPVQVGDSVTLAISPLTHAQAGRWALGADPILVWFGDSQDVFPSYKGRASLNISTGALLLKSVTVADSGIYVVEGSNPAFSANASLKVLAPVSNVTVTANVTDPVEFNDTVSLTCSASGSSLSFRWHDGSADIRASGRVHLSDDNRILTISGVLRSDKGPLYCIVSNTISNATSKGFSLNISYGPNDVKLTISRSQKDAFKTGSNITMSCSAQSSPPAQFQWAFNGGMLSREGQELRLENIQKNQSGNYTCWAHNTRTLRYSSLTMPITITGNSEVSVEVKPADPARVGDDVTLAISPPQHMHAGIWMIGNTVILVWIGDSQDVFPAHNGRALVNTSTGALTLRSVTVADSGVYTVRGNSPELTANVSLTVLEPVSNVRVTVNVTDPVEFNDTVSLTCSASGSSLSFRWHNSSSDIITSEHIKLSNGNRSLTISSVLRSDKGPLYCVASNGISNGTSQPVLLKISYGPDEMTFTINGTQNGSFHTGSNITMSCSAQSSPPAQFQWAFNGRMLSREGQELRLENIQENQSGNYTCWAHNTRTLRYSSGKLSLDVMLKSVNPGLWSALR
ncbi:carcinoembryonic antigen-related cell adhesion molecule 5-like [Megalops cyprinoides]|uniref:carcinoembryonic antigen-related cell adhesion molecule 5-like n=1 Tax=Megalops cyprinoides TaxID=118141 RepID=UPI0018640E30|nr:carcinoembryonic antigen-related cell adhesion molecule 5-like [Megalops cyprinoides]